MIDSPGTGKGASILVIEDEPLILETLQDMLLFNNHLVTLANRGDEGLRLFQEGHFDLVFTDLTLPGLSGWEVASAIKHINNRIPVVIVTGWGEGIDKSEMMDKGIDEILPKPFEIENVLGIVDRLLHRS